MGASGWIGDDRRWRVIVAVAALGAAWPLDASVAQGGRPGFPRTTQRDSAGVRIIEHGSIASLPVVFEVAAQPSLAIGARTADERYEFRSSIARAVQIPDGRIAIAMFNAASVLTYDSSGVHRRSIGRRGEAPGEFQGIGAMCWAADGRMTVFDRALSRLSVFGDTGRFIESVQVPMRPEAGPCFADGAMLITTSVPRDQWSAVDGRRYTRIVHLAAAPLGVATPIGIFALGDSTYAITLQRTDGSEPGGRLILSRPFGRHSAFVPDSGRVHVAYGDALEIRTMSLDGRLLRIVRAIAPRQPVTAEMRRAHIDTALAGLTRSGRDVTELRELLSTPGIFPDSIPAHGAILADPAGRLWVPRYSLPGRTQTEWIVFDRDGTLLGAARAPADIGLIAQIASAHVLTWRRVQDAEGSYTQVRRYAIRRVR